MDVGNGRGHRGVDAQSLAGRGRRSPAEADEDAGGTGAHEVQGRGVGGGSADDDGHIEFVDELLEVERFGVGRDMLGRDRGAADDEDIDSGIDDGLVELLGPLRSQGACHGDSGFTDLFEASGDEFGLDGCGVELLHPGSRHLSRQLSDFGQLRGGILVPGPQSFEVEDAESAELAERNDGLRRHGRVHGGADERQLELVGVDLPGQGHVFGIAGAPSGDAGDVVERIGATAALASADFDFRTHPNSLSHHPPRKVSAHYEERPVSPPRTT